MNKYPRLLAILVSILVVGTVQSEETGKSLKLVAEARKQVGVTLEYDSAYVALKYPKGDVPLDRGVCTDVVIRALRDSRDMDLQKLVHEDMKANFSLYPRHWGLSKPDRNIDHRRVPNLQTYFRRHAISLSLSKKSEDYKAGDIVTCMLPGNLPHIMIVSDKKSPSNVPLVIHNIGRGTKEEGSLFAFPTTGHYRLGE
ncbi:MAG: DUF1287 domain-containing protein [Armatimonadetes bacterium]|nr:DUF1287 domain-containing protein [Akkermansiaceae bacterium]